MIAVITCNNAYNYGAVLQAYASQEYIKSQNHECCIIDYEPYHIHNIENRFKNCIWRIYNILSFIRGKKVFKSFCKEYFSLTHKYKSLAELSTKPIDADVYIAGSDQIWNYKMPNGNDSAYFLEFAPENSFKASYAASIAQDEIDDLHKEFFKQHLSRFNCIAVREKSAEALLEKLGLSNIKTVCDPVFLLDKSQWESFSKPVESTGDYILLYVFNIDDEIIGYANKLKREKNMDLYIINTRVSDFLIKADKHFWYTSPNQFVYLFKNASYVVTNSFHGLAFSVIFQKQFFLFGKKTGGNSRLVDFSKSIGIEDPLSYKDYKVISEKVTEFINSSKEVMNEIISNDRKKGMKELVSVIIPTYNGSDTVSKTIESVFKQSYENIEIIVVDDNGIGTDEQIKTQKTIEALNAGDKLKYIIHEVSKRGSAARNTGFRYSKGKYIAFLDDDDLYLENNLERHVDTLGKISEDYAFSYCDFSLVRVGYHRENITSTYSGDFLYEFLLGKVRVGSSLLCYRRKAFESLGGFDESFKRHQDWELIVRTLDKYKGINTNLIGVEKVVLGRNTPKDPKISEEYRLYYLDKMSVIISKLGSKKKKDVLGYNYFEIAKDYFKAKRFGRGLYWVLKTRKPIYYFGAAVSAAINRKRKQEKYD